MIPLKIKRTLMSGHLETDVCQDLPLVVKDPSNLGLKPAASLASRGPVHPASSAPSLTEILILIVVLTFLSSQAL